MAIKCYRRGSRWPSTVEAVRKSAVSILAQPSEYVTIYEIGGRTPSVHRHGLVERGDSSQTPYGPITSAVATVVTQCRFCTSSRGRIVHRSEPKRDGEEDGLAKILNFGLAKITQPDLGSGAFGSDFRAHGAGRRDGTFGYIRRSRERSHSGFRPIILPGIGSLRDCDVKPASRRRRQNARCDHPEGPSRGTCAPKTPAPCSDHERVSARTRGAVRLDEDRAQPAAERPYVEVSASDLRRALPSAGWGFSSR